MFTIQELVKLVQADPVFEKAGRFLDIGSGSGAISVALLKANEKVFIEINVGFYHSMLQEFRVYI